MAGRTNSLLDVDGIRVGHHTEIGPGRLTGCTVVVAPPGGMRCGVDVRGGGPGTRETDLLSPLAAMDRVDALVLTGGSAYGLAAASGVADALGAAGIGFRVGPQPEAVVPIVPAAVIFDLGRGGDFTARPTAESGRAALAAAHSENLAGMSVCGPLGAGTGARAGGLRGGIGTASAELPGGGTIAALVVVNAAGSAVNPATGLLWGAPLLRPEDEVSAAAPGAAARERVARAARPPAPTPADIVAHTTLAVLVTDIELTKAQCGKVAGMAHDGMARALNPVHTMVDGDVAFAATTAARPAPDPVVFHTLLTAAADVVTRAVARAVWAAPSVTTPAGTMPGYRELLGVTDADVGMRRSVGGAMSPTQEADADVGAGRRTETAVVDRSYFDDLDRVRDELVTPVLDELLREGELDSPAELAWHSDPFATASGEVLTVRVLARGEELQCFLWSPDWGTDESKRSIRERFAGEVGDFVAESRFAGGDPRVYADGGPE